MKTSMLLREFQLKSTPICNPNPFECLTNWRSSFVVLRHTLSSTLRTNSPFKQTKVLFYSCFWIFSLILLNLAKDYLIITSLIPLILLFPSASFFISALLSLSTFFSSFRFHPPIPFVRIYTIPFVRIPSWQCFS